MNASETHLPTTVVRGAAAGLVGVIGMTAFQRLVEMPLTGRDESYAPANLVTKLLPVSPKSRGGRRRLNYAAHTAVGLAWGVGHALIARRAGLRGQAAIAAAFGTIYSADVLGNTALGLDKPWRWSRQDLAIDLVDKLLLAQITGLAFERLAGE